MLLQLLPRLNEFEHIVCSLTNKGTIGQKMEKLGIQVYVLENGKRFSLSAILKFKKIIQKERPDVLSTRLIHADIFGRIFGRLFGIKKIVCCLESVLDEPRYNKFFLVERLTSPLVNQYYAVSQSVKNKYVQKARLKPDKIQVIHNGIDLSRFSNLPDKTTAKKLLGLDSFYPLIGYAAKLRPERNHASLIKAFSLIIKQFPTAGLILAGDGPEKENLVQLVKELNIENSVKLLGNRSDVPQILAALDIFVSPSAYEGMSVAILEAMAAGLPIIASDIAPNRELIENEKNGFLVPPFKPETIAKKMIDLLDNQEQLTSFAATARETSKSFTLDNTAASLTKLYQTLVN